MYSPAIIEIEETDKNKIPEEWGELIDSGIFKVSGCLLAGGALLSYYNSERFSTRDLDIFFVKHPYLANTTAPEIVMNLLKDKGYKEVSSSPSGLVKTFVTFCEPEVQIICKTYDNVEELFNSFDLHNSQCAFDGNWIIKSKKFNFCLKDNKVTVNNINRPYNTLRRIIKYGKKGFNIEGALNNFCYMLMDKVNRADPPIISELMEYSFLEDDDQLPIGKELELCA